MTKKTCKSCELHKDVAAFSKAPRNKDGYANMCKPCTVVRNTEYWRTPYGRISQIFAVQTVNSRARGHNAPTYTRGELYSWANAQGLQSLIASWAIAGYPRHLSPSVDRKDVTVGYTLDNIRLVTWQENNEAQYEDRKSCVVVTKQNRPVRQLTLEGVFIAEYKSIAHAARETGCVRTNINAMCRRTNPNIKSVGGFLWEYTVSEKGGRMSHLIYVVTVEVPDDQVTEDTHSEVKDVIDTSLQQAMHLLVEHGAKSFVTTFEDIV